MIKQNAQHFVRPIAEMRDHTQENQKSFETKVFSKSFSPRTEWGSKCFGNELTQESWVNFSSVNFFLVEITN